MKTLLAIFMLFLTSCTSCDLEDEEFTPYPGGKHREKPADQKY